MYTVVVCPNCRYCWIVQDRPDRTNCRRCQKSHQFGNLRKFHKTEQLTEARHARTTVRAEVLGDTSDFETAKEAGDLDVELDSVVDETEYLEAQGIDVTELELVEERATSGSKSTRSEIQIVRDAISETTAPTETDVVRYANEHDVSEAAVQKILKKLKHDGAVIQTSDGFRIL